MLKFAAIMHAIQFQLELRPRSRWMSVRRLPDLLVGFWVKKPREENGKEEGEGEDRKEEGKKKGMRGKGTKVDVTETCHAGPRVL